MFPLQAANTRTSQSYLAKRQRLKLDLLRYFWKAEAPSKATLAEGSSVSGVFM